MNDAPSGEQRRLQAIVFTDMWQFSRLMGEDEARTIRLVEEQRQLVRHLLPRFEGREHETIGDANVLLFDSAHNAVAWAVELQRTLATRNATLPAAEQLWLRIGIHLDDIVLRDGHIYGDGVNIAARTEPQADKGGICVTEAVRAHVRERANVRFQSLGMLPLKNIANPPAIYAVIADGTPAPKVKKQKGPGRAIAMMMVALAVVIAIAAVLRATRPLSPSADDRASAHYREGLRLLASLDVDGMVAELLAAVERDPGLAGARLRLAAWSFVDNPIAAREQFVLAQRHRDRLDSHDTALLQALTPYLATTVDHAAFIASSTKAFNEQQSNELRYWRAYALHLDGRYHEAQRIAEQGPYMQYLPLMWIAAVSALQRDDGQQVGLAHLQRCNDTSHRAPLCMRKLAFTQMYLGQCAALEDTAREWVARDKSDSNADRVFAYALAVNDAPLPAVVEAFVRGQSKHADAQKPLAQAMDQTRMAAWLGDFDACNARARDWLTLLGTHPDIGMQVMPVTYLVGCMLEQGNVDGAAAEASTFLARAPAFDKDAFGDDWTIFFDSALAQAGKRDDIEQRRRRWLNMQRERRSQHELLVHHWRDAWGEWVRTEHDAKLAKAAYDELVADGLTVPPIAVRAPGVSLALGQTLLLSGDAKAALPLLEQAATSCVGVFEALRMTRAWLMLARARAAIGDVDGARAAYDVVIERWGDARLSVSAAAARSERDALPSTTP